MYITNPYFAPEHSFIDLLAAAAKRGVDVRILTAGPRTDVNVVRNAGRAWYGTLLEAGTRVFEWQPSILHAKTFVADGQWSTIGSMTFDNRSMALNDESTLMVLDSTIGRQMVQMFLDDLRHAEEITPHHIPATVVVGMVNRARRQLHDASAIRCPRRWR